MAATKIQMAVSARDLYDQMRRGFDFSPVIWTMRRYDTDMSEARATELLEAFLQWVSLVPSNTPTNYVVMFQTPVEEAFHAFVLNTRAYAAFCEQFMGFFFHHDPLTDEAGPEVEQFARYTVDRLKAEFGEQLHPELRRWEADFAAGTYRVACVGPGGRCHV